MHKILCLAAFGLSLAAGAAQAASDDAKPSEARVAQQARMKTCNADAKAKSLKGDERKAFMGDCLKKKA
jgi:hypothetical protein